MAAKTTDTPSLTASSSVSAVEAVPTVQIYLPLLEQDDSGAKVDQTEHVTLNGETTIIQRGQYVNVKIPVFLALRVKYPNL
jgi:hypothetical protein